MKHLRLLIVLVGLALLGASTGLVHAAPDDPEAEVRKLLAAEDFASARKAALALTSSEVSARWLMAITELERAAEADQVEAMLNADDLAGASKLVDRLQRVATREAVSSLPRIQILKEIVDAKAANKNARGSTFLRALGAAIGQSDAAYLARQGEIAKRLALVGESLNSIQALGSELTKAARSEQNSQVANTWKAINDEAQTLRKHFAELDSLMALADFNTEGEKLERAILAVRREAAFQRANMLYFQRAYQNARSAAKEGLAVDPSDRRFQKIISDLDTLTESQSLMERLGRK